MTKNQLQVQVNNVQNQLEDPSRHNKNLDPCILVIFGASGDLTARKLMPALYNLNLDGQLPGHFACVGFARRHKTDEEFRQEMYTSINQFSRNRPVNEEIWKVFREQIVYHESEFDSDAGYESLAKLLKALDVQFGTKGNRIFYLSTQPSFFPLIIKKLHEHQLIYDSTNPEKWSRVVIEKPFGRDLQSAEILQKEIVQYLNESQIYRIDHYLGKETVQNLLVFRFSNSIFESVWNNHHIKNVQITVSEEMGIGTRGRLWEEAGMLRDIVQNHMMQLLCLVAMEPPTSLKADAIHNEKVKIMEALRPIPLQAIDNYAVRGQYGPGYINGNPVCAYTQENLVDPNSTVETYAALKLYINNWRWDGVPFYLRAGKRLPKRVTEIAIIFKDAPGYLYQTKMPSFEQSSVKNNTQTPEAAKEGSNTLVIRIQPDEGISLKMNCKIPGFNNIIQPVKMDFLYGSYFGAQPPEAYERLICDCISGDKTLFARVDEVLASWKLLTPILEHWKEQRPSDFPNYASGTWGPLVADQLIANNGFKWRLI